MTFDQFCLQLKATDEEREALLTMLASYRLKRFLEETEPLSAILLRTIAAEAERTGSWHVPPDLQERVRAWVAERDGGTR